MFTPQIMVIKMSKMTHFLYFLLKPAKSQSHFGQNIYVHLKDALLDSELPLATYQPLKIQSLNTFLLTQQFFDISSLDISQTVTPKPMNHTIF